MFFRPLTRQWFIPILKLIVEEEQKGKERVEYGKQLLKGLSRKLTSEFGKGFSVTNLKQMRKFFLTYSKGQTLSDQLDKTQTLSAELKDQNNEMPEFNLSWSHYLLLMRIDNPEERKFYEIEAVENNWSLREL